MVRRFLRESGREFQTDDPENARLVLYRSVRGYGGINLSEPYLHVDLMNGKGRGGKTTLGNGKAWSSASPRGQWITGKNGENWLQNHLWCPNDPRG